jgi:energy-coupling factor transporter ATP-binding protein EcfA2
MDKEIQLYVIFIAKPYTIDRFLKVTDSRMKRFPNVKTAAIADRTSGEWRVREIVERDDADVAAKIVDAFPLVDEIRQVEAELSTPEAISALEGAGEDSAVDSVPVVDEDVFESAMRDREIVMKGLSEQPDALLGFAHEKGIVLDCSLATDLLAVSLASQLVLFAGPSGTGKSTMARLLRSFFARADRQFEIEALRQWLTPDDLAGYYSVLGRQYATASGTATIVELHETSVGMLGGPGEEMGGPPVLLVEEMNLSPPEGYLAPVIHGLSSIASPILRWKLHTGGKGAIDESASVSLPEVALFGPYPRVFGTINVDASAHAPARKVAARSSVVLLEPSELSEDTLVDLAGFTHTGDQPGEEGRGERFLGDPEAALRAASEDEVALLARKLREFIADIAGVQVSNRDAKRCLTYMAYFRALCGSQSGEEDQALQIAVENAFSHCVLPTVEFGRFLQVLEALEKMELSPEATEHNQLGGLLGVRVERLLKMAGDGSVFGDSIDFWSALS